MGMVLNGSHDYMEFNWTGWGYMRKLLIQLGEDTSEMDGMNDGRVIKAGTTQSWGCAILKALEEGIIHVRKTPDKTYMGGFKTEPVIGFDDKPTPLEKIDEETRVWLKKMGEQFLTIGRVKQC